MRAGIGLLLALCWCVMDAQAQTRYHCRDDRGNTYSLFRPCPEGTRTTAVVGGPAPSQPSYSSSSSRYSTSPGRSVPDTPDHYQYMGARCRSLDENIRSAYSRGIKADVVDGMRREYRRDCRDEERDAYSRLSGDRSARERQRREDEKAALQEANAAREQEARFAQQCAESRRILTNKRARTDLTEGEKNDLRRFEEAFMARCKR